MTAEYRHSDIDVNRFPCLFDHRDCYIVNAMRYGERLKAARKHAGLTQVQLAERAGVAQATVSELEHSQAQGSAFTVQFARACGVSPDWLATGAGVMVDYYTRATSGELSEALRVMEELPPHLQAAASRFLAAVAAAAGKEMPASPPTGTLHESQEGPGPPGRHSPAAARNG